jgi:hypothetical protein
MLEQKIPADLTGKVTRYVTSVNKANPVFRNPGKCIWIIKSWILENTGNTLLYKDTNELTSKVKGK